MRADLAEVKNVINEIQSNLNTLTGRVTKAEDQISDLEDKLIEKKDQEEARNKQLRSHENTIREINDAMKRSSIRIIGISEGVEKERRLEDIVEQILDENFPDLGNGTSVHVLEAERTTHKISESRKTSIHLIVKFMNHNFRQEVLRAARGKRVLTYRGRSI